MTTGAGGGAAHQPRIVMSPQPGVRLTKAQGMATAHGQAFDATIKTTGTTQPPPKEA